MTLIALLLLYCLYRVTLIIALITALIAALIV